MARKTLADLEQEILELTTRNEFLEKEPKGVDADEVEKLIIENTELQKAVKHSADSEARLMAQMERIGESAENGDFGSCITMTAEEYGVYSAQKGTHMGRKLNKKTNPTIEDLRAKINSNWTPSIFMAAHGLSVEDFKQLVWKLSKKEMRDNPIRFSIERDTISQEG